jgi:hypothetical protein
MSDIENLNEIYSTFNCKKGGAFKPQEYKRGFAEMNSMVYNQSTRKDIDGYKYLPEFSNEEQGTWVDTKAKELVICFRGSITREDWLETDLRILIPIGFKSTNRYIRSRELAMKAYNKYKGYNVVLTGHSLGSHIATAMWQEFNEMDKDTKFVVYNRGSSPFEIFSQNPKDKEDRIHYHAEGDIISDNFLKDTKTTHYVSKPTKWIPHLLGNFY